MKQFESDLGRYAIGQQSFEVMRQRGAVYVDKTMYAYKLLTSTSQYYFLARPRRFGKSLFLSMLKCVFEGKRELFEGLYIDSTDWEWEKYPVLHLDLNTEKYAGVEDLELVLDNLFENWEKEYGVKNPAQIHSVRLKQIIEAAHRTTGKPVVILVDEYDKPMVNNLNERENFEHYRDKMAGIYSNFKSSADHIRLVFMTGVSRFSKLSVFSGLNNLKDISFVDEYADICGITQKEMESYYPDSLEALAHKYRVDKDGIIAKLKAKYDGYRFAETGSDIYNPWSLLNSFDERNIRNYWNDTGLPTILAKSLSLLDVDLKSYLNSRCSIDELIGFDLDNPNPIALLYQTGYVTIKDYDFDYDEFILGVPNSEVEYGLFNLLLPYYANLKQLAPNMYIRKFYSSLIKGRTVDFMRELSNFFASIEYPMHIENENNFHNAFYVLTRLIGLQTSTEVYTSDGRIDLLIETKEYLYIIELKYDSTAEAALRQIEDKQYASKFAGDPRKLYLIGASFDSTVRRIGSYEIAEN